MSKRVYVLEYSSNEWGEHMTWDEKEFDSQQAAEAEAILHMGWGDAVRLYLKEV